MIRSLSLAKTKKIWLHLKNENTINKISLLERYIPQAKNLKLKTPHVLKESLAQKKKDYVDFLRERFKSFNKWPTQHTNKWQASSLPS